MGIVAELFYDLEREGLEGVFLSVIEECKTTYRMSAPLDHDSKCYKDKNFKCGIGLEHQKT